MYIYILYVYIYIICITAIVHIGILKKGHEILSHRSLCVPLSWTHPFAQENMTKTQNLPDGLTKAFQRLHR